MNELKKLVPSIESSDLIVGKSGVRATVLGRDGNIVEDFKIIKSKNNIHVLNAPSPAATASLAIGDQIVKFIMDNFNLKNIENERNG